MLVWFHYHIVSFWVRVKGGVLSGFYFGFLLCLKHVLIVQNDVKQGLCHPFVLSVPNMLTDNSMSSLCCLSFLGRIQFRDFLALPPIFIIIRLSHLHQAESQRTV